MGQRTRNLVLSGYYGFANSGDEAVLHAILQALREEAKSQSVDLRLIVLSGAPEETARLHGVEAVHRMRPFEVLGALRRADGLISGGGSLLQDVTSAKSMLYYLAVIRLALWLRKPVFIYAQGIGPIRNAARFGPMIHSAFAASRYVSVRDEESKQLLVSFGLKPEAIDVVPDPVMGLGSSLSLSSLSSVSSVSSLPVEAGARSDAPEKRVGISVRFWREDRAELVAIAEALMVIAEREPKSRFEFLPFHLPSDKLASEFVRDKLLSYGVAEERVSVHPGTEHPSEMLSEAAACDVLIGMRLHSLIYAATAGVPPVGISYDPKIDQFIRRLGEATAGSTDALPSDKLAEMVLDRLAQGKDGWREGAFRSIDSMQQTSRKPAQQIIRELRI